MTKRRSSLTGSWSGAYRYPRDSYPETVFNAQIEETAGAFTGRTQEPNLTEPHIPVAYFEAEIEGVRTGASITFTKVYVGAAEVPFSIRYEGQANDALTRVDGRWSGGGWGSTFFMVRDDDGEAVAAEEAATAEITVR